MIANLPMTFLNTEPAAIDRRDFGGAWRKFRVGDPRRRLATLQEILRVDAPLTIGAVSGLALTASLWAVDDVQGKMVFSVDPQVVGLSHLLAQPEIWAAAYLDDAKVQFTLHRLLADRANNRLTLHSDATTDMYHLPRRRSVRVRRLGSNMPRVHLQHPAVGAGPVVLGVADVSLTGCALRMDEGQDRLGPGLDIRRVQVELDDQVTLSADLRVQHVTRDTQRAHGLLVGCAWQNMPVSEQELLQGWIRRGWRRRELITLSLD